MEKLEDDEALVDKMDRMIMSYRQAVRWGHYMNHLNNNKDWEKGDPDSYNRSKKRHEESVRAFRERYLSLKSEIFPDKND